MPCCLRISKACAQNLQAEDVAFPRQQVVLDVQPPHRLEVRPDDGVGDECGHLGGRVAAVLDVDGAPAARTSSRVLSASYHSVTRA